MALRLENQIHDVEMIVSGDSMAHSIPDVIRIMLELHITQRSDQIAVLQYCIAKRKEKNLHVRAMACECLQFLMDNFHPHCDAVDSEDNWESDLVNDRDVGESNAPSGRVHDIVREVTNPTTADVRFSDTRTNGQVTPQELRRMRNAEAAAKKAEAAAKKAEAAAKKAEAAKAEAAAKKANAAAEIKAENADDNGEKTHSLCHDPKNAHNVRFSDNVSLHLILARDIVVHHKRGS